jgi:hypothetical protein
MLPFRARPTAEVEAWSLCGAMNPEATAGNHPGWVPAGKNTDKMVCLYAGRSLLRALIEVNGFLRP